MASTIHMGSIPDPTEAIILHDMYNPYPAAVIPTPNTVYLSVAIHFSMVSNNFVYRSRLVRIKISNTVAHMSITIIKSGPASIELTTDVCVAFQVATGIFLSPLHIRTVYTGLSRPSARSPRMTSRIWGNLVSLKERYAYTLLFFISIYSYFY